MQTNIEEKEATCKDCGKTFTYKIGHILGVAIPWGKDYCPECSRKYWEEQKRKEEEAENNRIQAQRERWRSECGIPLHFRDSRFENFNMSVDKSIVKMEKQCQEYAEKFSFTNPQLSKTILMFSFGIWGLGKTRLVCATANAILDKWKAGDPGMCPVTFISEPQLFLRIRATFNRQNGESHKETEDDIYRKLTRVPLLILDDVGKEEVSDPRFVQRVLFAIINGRYENMLPIIITANLDADGLDRHMGGDRGNSASMDRLIEMTGNIFWELKGQSYRDVSKRMSG